MPARETVAGGRLLERMDLKDHAHGVRERDTVIGHERQPFVVIHDDIHGLDPDGVDSAIEHDPFVFLPKRLLN